MNTLSLAFTYQMNLRLLLRVFIAILSSAARTRKSHEKYF